MIVFVNFTSKIQGKTPLHLACDEDLSYFKFKITLLLIDAKADASIKDSKVRKCSTKSFLKCKGEASAHYLPSLSYNARQKSVLFGDVDTNTNF